MVEAFVEDIRRWAFGCGLRASLRDLRVALTTSVANINFSLDDKGMLVSSKTSTATATVTLVFGVVLGGACVRELAVTVTDLALLSFEFSLRGNGFWVAVRISCKATAVAEEQVEGDATAALMLSACVRANGFAASMS